jgi:hypothetical protein
MGFEAAAAIGIGMVGASAIEQNRQARHAANAAEDQSAALQAQARAQREQFALEQRKADIANARTVRQAVRQARVARAAIINAGGNTGTLGSSGVQGGASSVGAQLSSNLDFFGTMAGLNRSVTDTQIDQSVAAERAGVAGGRIAVANAESAAWGAMGQLGGTIFHDFGGFKKIFGGNKQTIFDE